MTPKRARLLGWVGFGLTLACIPVSALILVVLYGIIIVVLAPLDRLLAALVRRRARPATRAGAQ